MTLGEKLWLWRHRQKTEGGRVFGPIGDSFSQQEAAFSLGTRVGPYSLAEIDRVNDIPGVDLSFLDAIEPTLAEKCAIARRRSGMGLQKTRNLLDVSTPWLIRMERLGDPRIIAFWEERGYNFG